MFRSKLSSLKNRSISPVFTVTAHSIMTRVRPEETAAATSSSATNNQKFHSKGIKALVTMATRLFGTFTRKLERRESTSSSDESIESGIVPNINNMPAYTQSSTRKLAFGTTSSGEEQHKPLDDFYNNSTLTNFSKLFCAIVLLTAFFLVMSRTFQFFYDAQQASVAARHNLTGIFGVKNGTDVEKFLLSTDAILNDLRNT